jgi:transcriptional regulator with XRE-family HTH domain
MSTPKKLQRFLKARKITQAELCRRAGVSITKVSDFMHGRVGQLSDVQKDRIREAFPEAPL